MIQDMDERHAEYLRERHDYAAWERETAAESELLVGRFALRVEDLPGWNMIRLDQVPVEGARLALQSLWGSAEQEGVLLRIDIIEMPDVAAARTMLLHLLGEFQSPEIARQTDARIGQVAFESPDRTTVLFVRSNVVAMIRNAGPEVIAVDEPARQLDDIVKGQSGTK